MAAMAVEGMAAEVMAEAMAEAGTGAEETEEAGMEAEAMVRAVTVEVGLVVTPVEAAKGATMAARAQQSQECACASPQHRPAPNTVHTCPQ